MKSINTSNSNDSKATTARTNMPTALAGFEAAFDATADARAKLTPEDLLPINLEIPSAIAAVLGALPRARTLREQYAVLFSGADLAEIDAIDTYANALAFAQTAFMAASQPAPPLQNLFERASELRELLLSDATALAKRGIVDPKILSELKGGNGYLTIAFDLGTIVHMMREHWSEVAMRSAVQPAELDEAEDLYEQVTRAFAEREAHSEVVAAASADRARAYTLFVNAYDQLRRAASFIRWKQDDGDKFVPSLYAGRGGRGHGPAKPMTPDGSSSGTSATATSSSTVTPHDVSTGQHAGSSEPVMPGMPGGSPFVHAA